MYRNLLVPIMLVVLLRPAAVAALEIEGEGAARVVGGNVVTARARALEKAQQEALRSAIEHVFAEGIDGATAPNTDLRMALERSALDRPVAYMRTFRVLEEQHSDGAFRVRIAAQCDLARLRAELRRLGQRLSRDSHPLETSQGRPRIGVWMSVQMTSAAGEAVANGLRQLLLARLRQLDSDALELAGASVDVALDEARRRGLAAVAVERVELAAAPGVRGLELAGGRARAVTEALLVDTGEKLGPWQVDRWAAAERLQDACRRAAMAAAANALAPLVSALVHHWSADSAESNEIRVEVRGLTNLTAVSRICGALLDGGAGVSACTLRQLDRGAAASISVRTRTAAAELAKVLTSRDWPQLGLRVDHVGNKMLSVVVTANAADRAQ